MNGKNEPILEKNEPIRLENEPIRKKRGMTGLFTGLPNWV
ncbi:hypothetical protein JOC76_002156 [Neobacillus cucumis]|nr:hypothetical protein [Neobacillus cucumis]